MRNSSRGQSYLQDPHGSEKVIVMDRFRAGASLSPLRQAEAYWAALFDGVTIPRRSQIDPRGLENILSYTFILERVAPGIARFRLAGQHLHNLAGMEVRGMPISSFFAGSAREDIASALEQVFDQPAIAEVSLAIERSRSVDFNEGRMILLPLRSDCDQINRILGVLVADGDDADGPGRFRITKTALRPISAATKPQTVLEPNAGFAEDRVPLSGRAPYLRLVK